MDGVFEHVVYKIRTWSNEVIEGLQDLQILSLLFVENIEPVLILVKLHFIYSLFKLVPLFFNHLFSFLYLFLLVLELFDLLVDLFLHHLEQILMLNLELVHYPSERLLEFVNFFIKLLSHFHL